MFNMYREEEKTPKVKRSLKGIIKDIIYDLKLNFECSAINRKKQIKKMQKLINEVEYTDVETMEQIRSTISRYELDCKMYGPAIDDESLQLFEQKKEQLKAYMQEIEDENEMQ